MCICFMFRLPVLKDWFGLEGAGLGLGTDGLDYQTVQESKH